MLLDAGLGQALELSRRLRTSTGFEPAPRMADRRSDIAALRRLAADLFASHRALKKWRESILAFGQAEVRHSIR